MRSPCMHLVLRHLHTQTSELGSKRISAFDRLGRRINCRLDSFGPFVGHGLNQRIFMLGICRSPVISRQ